MDLFRRKPKAQSQRPQAPAHPDTARAELALSSHAPLDISHPVFQLELGMDTAAVVGLLGEEYLSRRGCWLYSDTPAAYDLGSADDGCHGGMNHGVDLQERVDTGQSGVCPGPGVSAGQRVVAGSALMIFLGWAMPSLARMSRCGLVRSVRC